MLALRVLLIIAVLTASVVLADYSSAATTAKSLSGAQAKRYTKNALAHKFGKSWKQRDQSVTYLKCKRKAALTFQCRVVWLHNVVVYDGHVGISLRPDPADDGWYYDMKIKRSNYNCSNLCRKRIEVPWTRGGTTGSG